MVLEVQPALVPLLRDFAVDRLVPMNEELPPADVFCPLLSLPGLLRTTLETIPADVPYLFASPALVERWREHTDPELPGEDSEHAPSDTALRGEAHFVHPAARVVVHPARRHHAQHLRDERARYARLIKSAGIRIE